MFANCLTGWRLTLGREVNVSKKQAQLKKFLSVVDKETGHPTEKSVLSVIRSAVRKAWMRSATKLSLLAQKAVYVDDVPPEERPSKLSKNTKWLYKCEMCGEYSIASNIEVDHKSGEHSLLSYDDMAMFTRSLLDVGWDDLSVLDKECHAIKTYSERYGISLEDAITEKGVIEVINLPATKQKEWLKERGVTPASNVDGRRQQVREVLKGDRKF